MHLAEWTPAGNQIVGVALERTNEQAISWAGKQKVLARNKKKKRLRGLDCLPSVCRRKSGFL